MNQGGVALKESEVSRACSEVSKILSELEQIADELEMRFSKVLHPVSPQTPNDKVQQGQQFETELGSVIHGFAQKVMLINERINYIIRRCEL